MYSGTSPALLIAVLFVGIYICPADGGGAPLVTKTNIPMLCGGGFIPMLALRGGKDATADGEGGRAEGDQSEITERKLFGGAIRISLPTNYEDISAVRPVPDNQEVFADRLSDDSLIVEILESVDLSEEDSSEMKEGPMPPPRSMEEGEFIQPYDSEKALQKRLESGRKAAETVFWDIANCTESEQSHIITMRCLREEEAPLLMRRAPCPKAWISLWLVSGSQRIKKFRSADAASVDVLLHVFVARLPNVESDVVITLNLPLVGGSPETLQDRYEDGSAALLSIVKSLDIRDWHFFGGDGDM